jgi:hypothetical protein
VDVIKDRSVCSQKRSDCPLIDEFGDSLTSFGTP